MTNKENHVHSEEFRKEFGRRVRELRIEKGVSIEEARKALNVPRSTYSGWELGHRVPLSKSLDALSEYLETSTDYLMQKVEQRHPNQKDLKEILDLADVEFEGKRLTQKQKDTISDIINAIMKE